MTNHVLNHENKALQSLMNKVTQLQRYNALFSQYVEPEVTRHCKVVRYDKNCLIVMVDSGHWATHIRFQIPDLMEKLRKHAELKMLSGIICKTRPPHSMLSNTTPKRTLSHLSLESSNSVLDTAKTLTDKRLREILEKIGNYLRK